MAMAVAGLAVTTAMAAAAPAPADRAVAGASQSPLPGYPHVLGVQLVHDHSLASLSRARAIAAAERAHTQTASAQAARPTTVPAVTDPTPACPSTEGDPGEDLCWWGGPVVRTNAVHLIFWEGTEGEHHPFSSQYEQAIEGYFENIAGASGQASNVYAVSAQYGDKHGSGEYEVSFNRQDDVYQETERALPAAGIDPGQCTDRAVETGAPTERPSCVTSAAVESELRLAKMASHTGRAWAFSLENVYFVFTPPGVGGCLYGAGEGGDNACALAPGGYCGYHSFFNAQVPGREPRPALFAVIPDDELVAGCDTYEQPNGPEDVDATLATLSREHNEIITDPEGDGWHDLIGEEAVAKCEPPHAFEVTGGVAGAVFGGPLGGTDPTVTVEGQVPNPTVTVLAPGTLYNQVIGAGHYFLPTEWSNGATLGGGRCAQRMLAAQIAVAGSARATVPTVLSGAGSGEAGDPVTYWVWTFGDAAAGHYETQVGTGEPTVSHTYAAAGNYTATLTAYDAYGNSGATESVVTVGAAPAPDVTTTTTTKTTSSATLASYTGSEIATRLGIAHNGAKVSGAATITVGHAQCPPACSAKVRVYTNVTTLSEGQSSTSSVLIGSASEKIAAGQKATIAFKLNATGRQLLRQRRTLAVTLKLVVGDQDGGSWQIIRAYTLTQAKVRAAPRS
jgi:hypothetical protein